MKIQTITLLSAAVLAISSPAIAHTGDHSAPLLANILHWLSSPTHALFSVLGVGILTLAITAMRKRRS